MLSAEGNLRLRERPERILVRFRHPEKLPIKSVRVNGRAHRLFDPAKGDVDITEAAGRVLVEARY